MEEQRVRSTGHVIKIVHSRKCDSTKSSERRDFVAYHSMLRFVQEILCKSEFGGDSL